MGADASMNGFCCSELKAERKSKSETGEQENKESGRFVSIPLLYSTNQDKITHFYSILHREYSTEEILLSLLLVHPHVLLKVLRLLFSKFSL